MRTPASSHQRLHDLDALRAAAMLLGIVYHVALSFALGFPWMVQDVAQAKWPFIFQAWVHGFRMQLFMLVSGFFTAMLWRKKGLKALLGHRCRRVLFPCLLGLVTVVPAMNWAIGFAFSHAAAARPARPAPPDPGASLWSALQAGNLPATERHLAAGAGSLTNLHPVFAVPPLQWAALNGRLEAAALLLDRGAPVDGRSRDGHTALHGAAFMGRAQIVGLLLERGADVNARSSNGETPLHNAGLDFGVVKYIAGLLGLPVDQARWVEGRALVRQRLEAAGGEALAAPPARPGEVGAGLWDSLVNTPVFVLIWFLWFLVWLVAIFSLYSLLAERFGWRARPHWLVLSPANLLWLVPLTMVPTALMDFDLGIGPDTSMGIIPMPHVLLYYALFFFFGAIYYDCDDRENRLGGSWRWMLPLTLLVVFPLALEFATGTLGFRDALLPKAWHRPASVLFQSVFAWTMSFSSIGLFRAVLTRESHTIRYLSDSSYWLYLAHLPLCIAGQAIISQWTAPVWVKLPLFALALTAFLLLTYHFLVRHTWIGRLLNGPRKQPVKDGSHGGVPSASPG
ncbi:MAG: ankyrin repeat domain-containing protein [Limisphaerales bacterium]